CSFEPSSKANTYGIALLLWNVRAEIPRLRVDYEGARELVVDALTVPVEVAPGDHAEREDPAQSDRVERNRDEDREREVRERAVPAAGGAVGSNESAASVPHAERVALPSRDRHEIQQREHDRRPGDDVAGRLDVVGELVGVALQLLRRIVESRRRNAGVL